MKKMMQYCSLVMTGLLLSASLTACGKGTSTTAFSSTTPAIFYAHSVVFRNNTTLVAWGNNAFGQLGDNSSTNRLVPVVVTNLAGVHLSGVSVGGTHTLAFNNHTTLAWGNNGFGQLGNNSATASSAPVRVLKSVNGTTPFTNMSSVTAVAAGGNHSLAIVNPGPDPSNPSTAEVWAWGSNVFGQLGNKTTTSHLTAVPVQDPINGSLTLVGVTKIAAGGSHSLARRTNGQVSSWGYNGFGQLGQKVKLSFQNLSSLNRPFPDQVMKAPDATTPLTNVIDIAAGGSHSLAIVNPDPFNPSTAEVWAWGYNFLGQLGVGDTTDRNVGAVQVPDITGITAIAAGADHSLALKSDGTVWAWGFNFFGQLGNGATLGSNDAVTKPVQVLKAPGAPLTDVVKIIAIGNHSLAIDKNGVVRAWGDNTFGQLGNNTNTNSAFAVEIGLFSSFRP